MRYEVLPQHIKRSDFMETTLKLSNVEITERCIVSSFSNHALIWFNNYLQIEVTCAQMTLETARIDVAIISDLPAGRTLTVLEKAQRSLVCKGCEY